MGKLLPAQAADQADGRRTQRDERIDGIARQHAADDVGHHAHDETRPRSKEDARQQHRQTAQMTGQSRWRCSAPGKRRCSCNEQGHRRQGAHGDLRMVVHINCPPVFQELRGEQKETPSPVTNRTKEGVSSTNFTSGRRRADGLARTQVHAAAGCRANAPRVSLRPQHNSPLMRHLTRIALLC